MSGRSRRCEKWAWTFSWHKGTTKGLRSFPVVSAKQPRRVFPEDLFFNVFAEAEGKELLDVPLHRGHARRGPVRAPDHLVRDLRDAGKVFRECLGRDA